ncbi:MAG TPA: tRNA (guanosine(37)-N1)-methyltransferase TrmD [Planctomycetota bacterium]|nr:tRNA (guanosine(37)-N1)-methyltransferase TrmD [Planctomycetota bacterium]
MRVSTPGPHMHATVVTLFPELFEGLLRQSVFGRAVRRGLVRVDFVNLREFGEGRHRVVDDRPFGGGPGMVLMAEPVLRAVEAARARHPRGARLLYLTPQGTPLVQARARSLAADVDLVLLCGRYEGIDERAIEILQPEEISIGDYVLSGGELPAMVILDAVARLRPGVLGDERSPEEDSFGATEGLLDHPHYTRPLEVRGQGVPEVLRSGDHGAIARWRRERALDRTARRRPDLLPPSPGPTADGTS